jgi:hypothetical protein
MVRDSLARRFAVGYDRLFSEMFFSRVLLCASLTEIFGHTISTSSSASSSGRPSKIRRVALGAFNLA